MSLRLTPLHSRLIAASLIFLVLASFITAVAFPTWWLHKRYDSFLADYTDRLTRYLRVAALQPSMNEIIANVEKSSSRNLYLKSPAPTLAAAELQGLVSQIIETYSGRVISSQIQTAKEDTQKNLPPKKVAIIVQLIASTAPLQLILHAVESHEPYLFIDQLTVRANQGRGYKAVPGVQPEFSIQLTVSAYIPIDGSKS